MYNETHGRAQLEIGKNYSAIIIWNKLSDDMSKTPRPVKHVGNEKYIRSIWNKMKKDNRYLKDVVTFEDCISQITGVKKP